VYKHTGYREGKNNSYPFWWRKNIPLDRKKNRPGGGVLAAPRQVKKKTRFHILQSALCFLRFILLHNDSTIFKSQFSIFNFQFSILGLLFSIYNSQFSLWNIQFSICTLQFFYFLFSFLTLSIIQFTVLLCPVHLCICTESRILHWKNIFLTCYNI
jgi:hypothetical protein